MIDVQVTKYVQDRRKVCAQEGFGLGFGWCRFGHGLLQVDLGSGQMVAIRCQVHDIVDIEAEFEMCQIQITLDFLWKFQTEMRN